MAYSPIGNRVILERLKIESVLVNAYSGYSRVLAQSPVNDALVVDDVVITPYKWQEIPGEDDLIVAKIEDIAAKKV